MLPLQMTNYFPNIRRVGDHDDRTDKVVGVALGVALQRAQYLRRDEHSILSACIKCSRLPPLIFRSFVPAWHAKRSGRCSILLIKGFVKSAKLASRIEIEKPPRGGG